jgi:hypothetical protein
LSRSDAYYRNLKVETTKFVEFPTAFQCQGR